MAWISNKKFALNYRPFKFCQTMSRCSFCVFLNFITTVSNNIFLPLQKKTSLTWFLFHIAGFQLCLECLAKWTIKCGYSSKKCENSEIFLIMYECLKRGTHEILLWTFQFDVQFSKASWNLSALSPARLHQKVS